MENKLSFTSSHEPEPNVWTKATNGDHDALTETPTAETTASLADENYENYDDQDDEHEFVNTETD